MIARTLAGGFRDLFVIMHGLVCKHATKPLQVKLRGQWTVVNPREWTRRTDFSISVGLGTGTPEQQLQKLMSLVPLLQQSQGLGLAGPQEVYEFSAEMWKAAGYKNPDRFLKRPQIDPQTGQPAMPPPQEDPMVQAEKIKAQANTQIAQAKQQADMQVAAAKHQADMQSEALKAQANQQREAAQAQADMQVQQYKIETDGQLEIEKTKMQLQLQDIQHSRDQETRVQIALINAAASALKAGGEQPNNDQAVAMLSQLSGLSEQIAMMAQALSRPKTVVRGADGRVVGVQ
jgi:hypothetical protein